MEHHSFFTDSLGDSLGLHGGKCVRPMYIYTYNPDQSHFVQLYSQLCLEVSQCIQHTF